MKKVIFFAAVVSGHMVSSMENNGKHAIISSGGNYIREVDCNIIEIIKTKHYIIKNQEIEIETGKKTNVFHYKYYSPENIKNIGAILKKTKKDNYIFSTIKDARNFFKEISKETNMYAQPDVVIKKSDGTVKRIIAARPVYLLLNNSKGDKVCLLESKGDNGDFEGTVTLNNSYNKGQIRIVAKKKTPMYCNLFTNASFEIDTDTEISDDEEEIKETDN